MGHSLIQCFCNKPEARLYINKATSVSVTMFHVRCDYCGLSGVHDNTKHEAIGSWNYLMERPDMLQKRLNLMKERSYSDADWLQEIINVFDEK